MSFDPRTQMSALQQVLVQDKASIGLLLAAGCGTAIRVDDKPLIPNIDGLTKVVSERISGGASKGNFDILIRQFGEDGKNNPNIEDMLSHIRTLKLVAGNGTVRGLTRDALDSLEVEVCSIIAQVVDQELPVRSTPHHHLAKWIRSASRTLPVELFTTNYDLLFEQALEDSEVPYFDGFIGARRAFFDLTAIEQENTTVRNHLPARWARLWKLHGSVNWRFVKDAAGGQSVVRSPISGKDDRLLIHPSHLKYDQSRRMPYLAMMDRLRAFVARRQAFLVICGYSFGDEHINEAITQGLRSNPNATAFALQFEGLDKYPLAVKVAQENPNLCLLARDGAVIAMKKAEWGTIDAEAKPDTETIGIEWKEQDGEKTKLKAVLTLGDFCVLGRLFAEMTGRMMSERGSNE